MKAIQQLAAYFCKRLADEGTRDLAYPFVVSGSSTTQATWKPIWRTSGESFLFQNDWQDCAGPLWGTDTAISSDSNPGDRCGTCGPSLGRPGRHPQGHFGAPAGRVPGMPSKWRDEQHMDDWMAWCLSTRKGRCQLMFATISEGIRSPFDFGDFHSNLLAQFWIALPGSPSME